MITEDLISYLISPPPQIIILKIFFIVFFLFLLFGIIYLLSKNRWLRLLFFQDLVEILTFRSYGLRKITKDWTKIIERLEKGSLSEAKLAIIEADDLLNDVLKRMGYEGESLGERIEQLTPDIISNLTEVLEAHKIRNNIIYDPDYRLSLDETRRILSLYKKALLDLEVL